LEVLLFNITPEFFLRFDIAIHESSRAIKSKELVLGWVSLDPCVTFAWCLGINRFHHKYANKMATREKSLKRNGFIGLMIIVALFFVMDAMSQNNQTVDEDGYIYEEYEEKIAHNVWFLPVYGRVKNGKTKVDGATIRLYKENCIVRTYQTEKNGKFEMELDLGAYYTLEVVKEGYITKRIGINTVSKVEFERMDYQPYGVDINLTSEDSYVGVNIDMLDYPFALVSYDHHDSMFVHDENYTEEMILDNARLLETAFILSSHQFRLREF
jgi:hypothetical protein